jgi:hypothetical protein
MTITTKMICMTSEGMAPRSISELLTSGRHAAPIREREAEEGCMRLDVDAQAHPEPGQFEALHGGDLRQENDARDLEKKLRSGLPQ